MERTALASNPGNSQMRIGDTFAVKRGLMGFAALWIFVFHVWILMFGGVPVLGRIEAIVKYVGFCGVDIFFFLSGGGLIFSISKHTVQGFYRRRLERIAIPFLIVAVCYAIYQKWDVLLFLSQISGVHFYAKTIYGFLWYVPAIITFYLLFPVYYFLFSRSKKRTLFTLAVLAFWFTASILLKNVMREDLYGFTNRIPIFLIGVLCGQRVKDQNDALPRWFPALMLAALAAGVVLSYLTNVLKIEILFPASNAAFPNILLTLSIVFLVPWVGKKILRRDIPAITKFFGFFGAMSFEFYCTQELILRVYKDTIGLRSPIVDNIALFAIVVAASLLLKWGSERLLKLIQTVF